MSDATAQAGASPASGAASASPWLIAVLVALATFMEVLDTTIANVVLPYIAGGMGVSDDEASWVVTTYLVANAVSLTASPFLARALGRKAFFLDLPRALQRELDPVRAGLESRIRSSCSASSRAWPAAAWCRSRSPFWRLRFRRRSAARPSRCSASRWLWRRWSARRSAAGWPTISSWRWCFLINGPVGLATIALIAILLPCGQTQSGGRQPGSMSSAFSWSRPSSARSRSCSTAASRTTGSPRTSSSRSRPFAPSPSC